MGTVFSSARLRLLTAASGFVLIAALGGCDNPDKKQSSTGSLEKAAEYRAKGDIAAALIETKNALQADPHNGQAHLLRGQLLADRGDIWGAEDELRQASAAGLPPSDWFSPLAHSLLLQQNFVKLRELVNQNKDTSPTIQAQAKAFVGDISLSENKVDDARKSFTDALALNAQDIDGMLGMAQVELDGRSFDKAADWLKKAKAAAPSSPEIDQLQARLDGANGDSAALEADLRRAAADKPDNPFYQLMLAQALVANRKFDEADKLLDVVLKRIPNHPLANHLRAVMLYRNGKYKEADELETTVLSAAPNLRAAQFIDGLAKYPLGQYVQSEHLLNGLNASGEMSDEASLVRAADLMQLNRRQEAYALVKTLEPKHENDAFFLKLAAAAAQANGDLPKSRDYYQRALAADPKNTDLLTALVAVKLDLGDTSGDPANLDKAIEAAPDNQRNLATLFGSLLRSKQFDKAQELAQKEQSLHPDKAEGWTMAGMIAAFQTKYDDAITNFTKALSIEPTASDAVNDLAAVYLQQGRVDLARSTVEDGFKRAPKEASICAMGAKVEAAAKNLDGVQTWLERNLDIDPKASAARADLIQVLVEKKEPQKAASIGLTGLQLTPGDPLLLKATAQAYLAANQPDKAVQSLRELITAKPDADNYYLLARAYLDLHDEARLRDTLETLVQKAPDFRPGRMLLARLLLDHKDSLDRANTMIADLAKQQPDDPDVIELQARAANLNSGPKAAIDILQKYLATEKTPSRNLVFLLSSAQWDAGDKDKSIHGIADWADAHPDDAQARMTLATRQIEIKHYDDAHKTLAAEIDAHPNNWVAQNNLAWVLMTQGDLAGAQAQIDSAQKLAGSQPDVLDTQGQIALARGDASHAVDVLKLATLNGTPSPTIRIHLAKALIASGKPKEAQDTLKAVVATAKAGPDADEAKALLASIKN